MSTTPSGCGGYRIWRPRIGLPPPCPTHIAAYIWVVTRHEIDYRGNVKLGESVTGRTWIEKPPKGAQFDRRVEFVNVGGKVIVSANTTWAMLDRASGRLMRVPAEVAAPFLEGKP